MGYTETHSVYVIAFDAAGNEMKSDVITVFIVHEEEEPTSPTTAMLGTREKWLWLPSSPRRRWPTG